MKMVKDEHIVRLNKLVSKYNFNVNDRVNGKYFVKKLRKYNLGHYNFYEFDIVFVGTIFARLDQTPSKWLTEEILKTHNISKIKLNRMIRSCIELSLRNRIEIFGIEKWNFKVKKIEWLSEYNELK